MGFSYQFFFYDQDKHQAVEEIVFKPHSPATLIKPAFELERQSCQELMDSLWQAGIRPSEGVASTGQLEALKGHLEDMRKLSFGLLTHELHYK